MNIVRIAAAAAIITLVTTAYADAKTITLVRETNLRKEPSKDSEALTLIPKGARIEVGQCEKEWCKVSFNGQEGYVIAQNLASARMPPPGGALVAGGPYGPPEAYPPAYGPAGYYAYGPYYPYGPYYGPYGYYYGGWGYRGWGWGRRW